LLFGIADQSPREIVGTAAIPDVQIQAQRLFEILKSRVEGG